MKSLHDICVEEMSNDKSATFSQTFCNIIPTLVEIQVKRELNNLSIKNKLKLLFRRRKINE